MEAIGQLRSDLVKSFYIIAKLALALVGLTLVMAITGIYAVINYLFYASTTSIATKLALGANRRDLIADLLQVIHWPLLIAVLFFELLVIAVQQEIVKLANSSQVIVLLCAGGALLVTGLSTYGVSVLCARGLIGRGYRGLLASLH